jgi:hypothetical protein
MIKDFGIKLTKQVEEIAFPNLENYLSTRYTFSVGKMVCEYCNFIAKNQQALGAHQRGCAVKKNMLTTKNENEITTEVQINTIIQTPVVKEKEKISKVKNTK